MKKTLSLIAAVLIMLPLMATGSFEASATDALPALPFEFSADHSLKGATLRVAIKNPAARNVQILISLPEKRGVIIDVTLAGKQRAALVEGVELNTSYQFFVRFESNLATDSFIGHLTVVPDATGKGLVVNISVDSDNSSLAVNTLSVMNEVEPNNSWGQANQLFDNIEMQGTIHIGTDRDWYRVSFPQPGNVNFYLTGIPVGCDYDLYLYDTNGSTLLAWGERAKNSDEWFMYRVEANKVYYVLIAPFQNSFSPERYRFRTRNYTQTWFSQGFNEQGSQHWNRSNLTQLFFPNMAACSEFCGGNFKCRHTPFFTTAGFAPQPNQLSSGHMNEWGCVVTSYAMILRNLGAQTRAQQWDMRSNTTGSLLADPFTVTMGNINWPQNIFQNGRWEVSSYTSTSSPVLARHGNIADSFGRTAWRVDLSLLTPLQKAEHITHYLRRNPEGVLATFVSTNGHRHTIVIAGSSYPLSYSYVPTVNPERQGIVALFASDDIKDENIPVSSYLVTQGTAFDSHFLCWDPGTTQSSRGNGAPLNQTWSFVNNFGGLDRLVTIRFVD